MRPWRLLPLCLFVLFVACDRQDQTKQVVSPETTATSTELPVTATANTDHQLAVPPGYEGPIDPQWPPTHPANLDVELKAARLIRRALKRGERPPLEELLEGDTPGVYAEEGRIGAFDFIEVVLGPMAHPDEKMPLVVLLHGRGGRPTIPQGPFLTTRPLRLFIPRGPDVLGDGYNWLATWTNSGNLELLSRSLAGRVDQLMPAIEAFSKLRPTEGKPVVAGFSQGGILSFALVTRYPQQFAAAMPIAGWLPPGLFPDPKKPGIANPPIFAFHGGNDTVVPTERGRATVATLKQLGVNITYHEFPGVGHVVTPEITQEVRLKLRNFFGVKVTEQAAGTEEAQPRHEDD